MIDALDASGHLDQIVQGYQIHSGTFYECKLPTRKAEGTCDLLLATPVTYFTGLFKNLSFMSHVLLNSLRPQQTQRQPEIFAHTPHNGRKRV